ncbi:hypothetical protein C4N20_15615 [Fusobacterium ulcerans]|uniref:Uncharacterized protein n=1 Tax=Fusobacterium ulcerans TaxID=861 RepID=A0AAX2JD01_9FUSO|nr:hypothetical protein [Fusobacterium ulcerans]AVQ29459.1 hypothetical protein C4N20_15615 [Fusobacterium ulcerans]EFS27044.1 hypothetical protein FUAG_02559 [Fusobacterium ulcerans ATCC 49185]SQJ03939.1 Uncharacterised protein [Fusobacterium ulcerans]
MEVKIKNIERNYIFKRNVSEEVIQNIENIVGRVRGNVVLAREKGINSENVDLPTEIVKAEIAADVMDELTREEKRFLVTEINMVSEKEKVAGIIKGEILNE